MGRLGLRGCLGQHGPRLHLCPHRHHRQGRGAHRERKGGGRGGRGGRIDFPEIRTFIRSHDEEVKERAVSSRTTTKTTTTTTTTTTTVTTTTTTSDFLVHSAI